jgi:hypothetical protein
VLAHICLKFEAKALCYRRQFSVAEQMILLWRSLDGTPGGILMCSVTEVLRAEAYLDIGHGQAYLLR